MGCECLGGPTAAMGQISLEEIESPPRYPAPAEPNLGWCEYTPKPESVAATETQHLPWRAVPGKSTSQAQAQGV